MDTGTLREADEAADQATGRLFPLIGVGSGGGKGGADHRKVQL